MTINAFKNNVASLSENFLNAMLSLQPFSLLYEGALIDSKTGAGVTENNVFDFSFAIRFTATGVTSMARAELEIAADGTGQDLTVEVRSTDFNPDGSNEGTLLKTAVVPKEFLPAAAAYWYVPLNLTGLTAGNNYWLIVKKVGDATNHFHLIGEAAQDGAHPCYYRAGTSGAWTANNAIHFKVYSGNTGVPVHEIYGTNGYTTIVYSSGQPSVIYFYLPPSDGAAGGIRDTLTLSYSSGVLTGGSVA